MRTERITGGDGANIVVYSFGAGPGIVILHGGGVQERDYHRLAKALADRFTVHLYNRRGRPDSAALTGTETIGTDIGDLAAVLDHTGARSVFGHSGGGFVALRAGLSLPLERIAVYDPGLSIMGRPRFAFLDELEEAVRAGDHVRAITIAGRAVTPDSPAAKLPSAVAALISRLFLRTPIGRRFEALMPTIPPEVRRIAEHDGPATDYAGITADVLLAAGARSPRYFTENCEAVAAAIPCGRAIVIPGASHNTANIAPKRFVEPFAAFFAGGQVLEAP
ncbi:alpha/beta hydrolase [Dactylosporangium vinaceum]|uniref:Alpha/beta fold hydrolase n=1 Tax=Dactylosporangium vinaceum TaxID=53362 RepID=A0ABV5M5G9_9ACTN|nr:alpha/beta hydrolase [Dactylosporangium vinaceum]UAB95553.1 alpha/beta hydrolase [Dactylosporangium vinaceum]